MEKFKISDIQEIFVADVERCHSLTQNHVTHLLSETTPSQESLDEALRQCHTLKGLAATVEAWGLSCLGADLEKLLELAGSWMHDEREKANGIFEFILDHMQDWYVMNQFTCMDMLPQAWDTYLGLRGIMDERWPGCLPALESADGENAQYVRLKDLEIAEQSSVPDVTEVAEVAAPDEQPTPELDVKDVQPIASSTQPAVPTPLRVVPPTLRHREEPVPPLSQQSEVKADASVENRDAQQSEPIAHVEKPAAPRPLQVVPPSLRRRNDADKARPVLTEATATDVPEVAEELATQVPPSVAQTATPELPPASVVPPVVTAPAEPVQQVEDAASATPPILRVARPALKRRAKKTEPPKSPVTESTAVPASASLEQMSVEPLAVEPAAIVPSSVEPSAIVPSAIEPLAAEDVFAALPPLEEPPVAALMATPAAAEFKPNTDADLLEMLGQEVAGYLTELSVNLTELAGNLADATHWEKTRRLFHTIKGTAATFSLDAVSAPAKAAEAHCIVAVEDASARTRECFETCVQRAHVVAKALHLPFAEQPLRDALELGLAQATNLAAASAVTEVSPLDPEMAGFFIHDARDQIQIIEQAVLRWEKGEQALEQVQAAQRGFHTIKGAANSIGLTPVAQSVHEVEAHLEGVVTSGATGSRVLFTFLLGAVDQLRNYLADLTRNTASPWRHDWRTVLALLSKPAEKVESSKSTATATTAAVAQAAQQSDVADDETHTLRIEADRLYQLMNLIGEMVIDRARLARKIEQLTTLHRALAERNGALTGSVQSFQEQFEFNLLRKERGAGAGKPGSGSREQPGSRAQGQGEFSELEFDRYDQFNVLARSLVEISHDIEELHAEVSGCLDSFASENVQFTQTSQELQRQVTGLSLVPVNTLFPRLQRAFRDALSVEGKEADLVLAGGEALLDKVVVDKVYAPLLHLLRNAAAHGIEDAVTRVRLHKPARGQVRLSATPLSNQIVIQIADDGGGIDAAAVRRRAVAKGWLPADAPALTPDQVVHFIFQPGFSTAAAVTSVSGRGIGLDVVRQVVEGLNGSVELKYEPDRGTTWVLRLPLTLAISEAILSEVGGTTFAFPLNFIESGLILDAPTTRAEDGREMFTPEVVLADRVSGLGDGANPESLDPRTESRDPSSSAEALPVVRLSQLFGLPGDAQSNKGLIVSVGDRRAIVVVDVVLRRQEVVIKQLDSVMALHPLLNGATLDAEGRVIPILNLPSLLKFAERKSGMGDGVSAQEPTTKTPDPRTKTLDPKAQRRVLIVDDSLSVRKVQERYLRDLGCAVVTAKDGLDALDKLRDGATPGDEYPFDLILTDLEMPRLNGYELITELHGNPAWAGIPVVVISSRGGDKYITKAMNLGATTFLAKPFTLEQLKQVVEHYAKVGDRG